eukprot:gene29574-38693_t
MVGYSVLYLPYTGLLFSVPHSKLKGSSGDVNVRIAEQVTGFRYRDVMCFAMGMLEMMGLLALFLISGIVPKDPSSSACSNGSCLSGRSGVWAVGYSCLPNLASGLTEQYKIFNTTAWYMMRHPTVVVRSKTSVLVSPANYSCKSYHGNYYSDPNKLFTPNNCDGFHSDSNNCMQTYCSCIAECSSLCLTKKMSSAYLALGVCFGVVSLLCVASICVKVLWKLASSSGTSNAAANASDNNNNGNDAAAITSYSGTDYTAVAVDSDPAVNDTSIRFSSGIVNSNGFNSSGFSNANSTNHQRGEVRNNGNEMLELDQDGSDVDTEEGTQAPNTAVTGFALAMLMLAGMLSCPVWYMASLWVGKIKTWQAASFLQCFLYFVLGFSLGKGLVNRTIAFCGVIGIGAGSWFLNDSIFVDIIDYDEFLTQRRNEGFFMCLRPLLLKLCSIPVMVGEMFPKRFYTAGEEARAKAFDMFPSLEVALDALTCIEAESPRVAVKLIFDRMRDWFLSVVIFAVLSLAGVILTSQMFFFRSKVLIGLFAIPVVMIICLGVSMTLFAFSYRRIKNANELLKPGGLPSVALMDKICKNRAMLIEMRDSKLPPSEVITLGKERLLQMLESTIVKSASVVVEPPIDQTDYHFENTKHDELTVWDVEMYSFLYEQSTGQSLYAHQRQQELRHRRSMRAVKAKEKEMINSQPHYDGGKRHTEEDQVSDHSSMYDNISDFDDEEEAAAAILDDKQLADLARAKNISISLNHTAAIHSTASAPVREKDGRGRNEFEGDELDGNDQL